MIIKLPTIPDSVNADNLINKLNTYANIFQVIDQKYGAGYRESVNLFNEINISILTK